MLFGMVLILIAVWKSAFAILDYFAEENKDLKFFERNLEIAVLIIAVYYILLRHTSTYMLLTTASKCLAVEFAVFGAFLYIKDSAGNKSREEKLGKFKDFLKKLFSKSAPIAAAIFSIIIIYNISQYTNFPAEINKYNVQFRNLVSEGKIEESYMLEAEYNKKCIFIPTEIVNCYRYEYSLEWRAKYYGYDIDYSPYIIQQ
jgi:hypothetical protein